MVEVDRLLGPVGLVTVPELVVAGALPEEHLLAVAEPSVGVAGVEQVELELVAEQAVHDRRAHHSVRRQLRARGILEVDGVHVKGRAEGSRGQVADRVLEQLVAEAVVSVAQDHEALG